MIATRDRIRHRESHPLQTRGLAQAALSQYGLAGATIRELLDLAIAVVAGDEQVFEVSFPADATEIHPYLGRLAGKSFTLSIGAASENGAASALAWVEKMAARCRDTDISTPEPVPACDGSLVTLVTVDGDMRRCVVYR